MKSVVHEMDLNKNNQEHFPEYQRWTFKQVVNKETKM